MPKGIHDQHPKGAAHGLAKLDDAGVLYIRKAWRDAPRWALHGLVRILAEKFNVSILPVQRIVAGDGWRHLEVSEVQEPFDRELLEEIQERRRVNAAARRNGRVYTSGEKKCRNEYVDKVAAKKRQSALDALNQLKGSGRRQRTRKQQD